MQDTQHPHLHFTHPVEICCLFLRNLLESLAGQILLEALLDCLHELGRGNPRLALFLSTRQCQILSHNTVVIHGVDDGLLQALRPSNQLRGLIEMSTLDQAPRPRENTRDRIRARLPSLLVLAVMSRDCPVCRFGLVCQTVRRDELRRHQT